MLIAGEQFVGMKMMPACALCCQELDVALLPLLSVPSVRLLPDAVVSQLSTARGVGTPLHTRVGKVHIERAGAPLGH